MVTQKWEPIPVCTSFSSSFPCDRRLFVWDCPSFLREASTAMYVPLRTTLGPLHILWSIGFLFYLLPCIVSFPLRFLHWITDYWQARCVASICVFSLVFFMSLIPSFIPFWWEKVLDTLSVFLNWWGHFSVLICDLLWRTFQVSLERMCIMLLWAAMFCDLSGLLCHKTPQFPHLFSLWMI